MVPRRLLVLFLTITVSLAMLAFTHALFGEGKDSPVVKFLIEKSDPVASETQAPNSHGKSNH